MSAVIPQTLSSLDSTSTWGSNEYRWRETSGDYEVYGLYTDSFQSASHDIKVDTSTNTWQDQGSSNPYVVTEQSDGTVLLTSTGYPNLFKFTKPTTASWISSGGGTNAEGLSTSTTGFLAINNGVLQASIPASTPSGNFFIFEGTSQRNDFTHTVLTNTFETASGWSTGNSSTWYLQDDYGMELDSYRSGAKKVHCNFW